MNELEAIKILHKMRSDLAKCYANTIDKRNALDIAIKSLSAKLSVRNLNNGWIPCSERLPEVLDYVLVVTKEGGRTICHRVPNQKEPWYDLHSENIKNIIAWQPLPQPYKE